MMHDKSHVLQQQEIGFSGNNKTLWVTLLTTKMALLEKWLLVVLLVLYSVVSCSFEEKEIQLLVLTPYPQPQLESSFRPSIADGPALHLAAELAAELANASSSILQGYHLRLQPGDSGCSIPFRAIEAFTAPLISSIQSSGRSSGKSAPIVGVIGPACSLSAVHVSSVSGRSEVALINVHLAGTVKLNDRTRYPYTFGILDSAELIALSMASLIKLAGWSKVALFFDSSREYQSSVVRQFNIISSGIENLTYTQAPVSDVNLGPFLDIANQFRIVFLVVDLDLLSRLMCMALHAGFSHPNYQFILVVEDAESIGSAQNINYDGMLRSCTKNQTRGMLNGSILTLFQLERTDSNFVTSSGVSLLEFKDMYRKKVDEHNPRIEETIYAVNFFDAVWTLILALNSSADTIDLSEYSIGQQNVTNHIREELLGLDFEGLSGRIRFSRSTGRIQQNASIFRVNGIGMTQIATYIRENDTIVNLTGDLEFVRDEFDTVILTVPKELISVMLCVVVFALLLTLFLNFFMCRNRNSESVKASSIKLIQMAFLGCYIHVLSLVFTIIVYGFSDVIEGNAICRVHDLLDFSLSVGLTVLFGSICVRLWRLYRIFNHFNNPGKLLSDYFLMAIAVAFVGLNLIFTIPAFFVDEYKLDLDTIPNGDPNVVTAILKCKRNNFFLWFFLGLLVASVLLTTIFVLGFLTRRIPMKNFKTLSMIYMSYTLTAVIPSTLGVYFLFVSLEETAYVYLILKFCTLCVLLLSLIVIPCLLLFIPPILPILRHKTLCFN